MKYRLTVKGQVALATVVLLVFAAGTFLKPSTPDGTSQPAQAPQPAAEAPAAVQAPPAAETPKAQTLSEEDRAQLRASACTVYFEPNRWEIGSDEIQKLTAFYEIMEKYPQERVVIAGNIHALSGSETAFGQDLSLKRAQVTAQVLIGKGADERILAVISNGGGSPISDIPADAWKNRRAEVYFESVGLPETDK